MPTTTPNLGLTKPDLNQKGWGPLVNANFDLIDAAAAAPQIIASSATLVFDFSLSRSKVITLTSDVTSSSAINPTDGLEANFLIKTGAGGFGFVFPANFVNAQAISTANANNSAGLVLQQKWRYDLASTNWYQVTPLTY